MDDLNLENIPNESEETDSNGSLDALYRAAQQTQRLVEEQEELSQKEEKEKPDPLQEQVDIFEQLFASLDHSDSHGIGAGTVIEQAAVQESHYIAPEEPSEAEREVQTVAVTAEPEEIEEEPALSEESVLPEQPDEEAVSEEVSEQTEKMEKKTSFLSRFFEEDSEDEDDLEDDLEDLEEPSKEDAITADEPPKKAGFLRRLFLMDEGESDGEEEAVSDEEPFERIETEETSGQQAITEIQPEEEPVDDDYTEDSYEAETEEKKPAKKSFLSRFLLLDEDDEVYDGDEPRAAEEFFKPIEPEIPVEQPEELDEPSEQTAESSELPEDEPVNDDYAEDSIEETDEKESFLRRFMQLGHDDEAYDGDEPRAVEEFFKPVEPEIPVEPSEEPNELPEDEPVNDDYAEDSIEETDEKESFLRRFMQLGHDDEAYDGDEPRAVEEFFKPVEPEIPVEPSEEPNELPEDEPVNDDYAEDSIEETDEKESFLRRFMQLGHDDEVYDGDEPRAVEEFFKPIEPEIPVEPSEEPDEPSEQTEEPSEQPEDEPVNDDYAEDGYDEEETAGRFGFLRRFLMMDNEDEAYDEDEPVSTEELLEVPEQQQTEETLETIIEEVEEQPKRKKIGLLRGLLELDEDDDDRMEVAFDGEQPEEISIESQSEEADTQDDTQAIPIEAMEQAEAEQEIPIPEDDYEAEPEDIPVISDDEFHAFMKEVEQEEETPRASFEEMLSEHGIDPALKDAKLTGNLPPVPEEFPEQFPEQPTTVILEVPTGSAAAKAEEESDELFDAEEAISLDREEEMQPPEWLEKSFEEICAIAPPLDVLRQDGPVMAREVARQKEWLRERHRAYIEQQRAEQEQSAETEKEKPETSKDDGEGTDAVFPDRSIDKPVTEPVGRENERSEQGFTRKKDALLLETERLLADNTMDTTEQHVETKSSEQLAASEPSVQTVETEPEQNWMEKSFDEICMTAPPLAALRENGAVMAREVARLKGQLVDEEEPVEAPQTTVEPSTEQMISTDTSDAETVSPAETKASAVQTEPNPVQHVTVDSAKQKEISAGERTTKQVTDRLFVAGKPAHKPILQNDTKQKKTKRTTVPPRDLNAKSNKMRQRAQSKARRSIAVALLTIIAVYISCAADFSGLPLPAALDYVGSPTTVLMVFIALLVLAMTFAYDTILNGIHAVRELKPNYNTLLVFVLLLNMVHCVVRLVSQGEEIPYVCIILFALFVQMRADILTIGGLRYTYKVTAGAANPVGIFVHSGEKPYLVKAELDSTDDFVAQTLQPKERTDFESIFTILAIMGAVVLSIIVCVSAGDMGRFIYVLAATATAASQIALFTASAVGQRNAARKMMQSGAAADGLRAANRMAQVDTIVMTDEDLFPADSSVVLEKVELRGQLNEMTALAYAASLTAGSSLGDMFREEVRERYGHRLLAHHVVRDPDGNVSGTIGGLAVMLGTPDYMSRHGIETGITDEDSLILMVEDEIVAVIRVGYRVSAAQFNAIQMLAEQHMKIVLHTRNRQVTTQRVEKLYSLTEGTVMMAQPEEDRAMQSPSYTAGDILCGLLAWNSVISFAECAAIARTESRLYKFGMILGILAAVIGMLLMAYLCFVFVPADARPIRMLLYTILWFVPVFFIANEVGRS